MDRATVVGKEQASGEVDVVILVLDSIFLLWLPTRR
jgi:hypothetical protein